MVPKSTVKCIDGFTDLSGRSRLRSHLLRLSPPAVPCLGVHLNNLRYSSLFAGLVLSPQHPFTHAVCLQSRERQLHALSQCGLGRQGVYSLVLPRHDCSCYPGGTVPRQPTTHQEAESNLPVGQMLAPLKGHYNFKRHPAIIEKLSNLPILSPEDAYQQSRTIDEELE